MAEAAEPAAAQAERLVEARIAAALAGLPALPISLLPPAVPATQAAQVAAVAVHLSTFWTTDPDKWF